MARSYYHTPQIGGWSGAPSEKEDKRRANRKMRRKVNSGDFDITRLREVSEVYTFAKDGKHYFADFLAYSGRRVSHGRRMK